MLQQTVIKISHLIFEASLFNQNKKMLLFTIKVLFWLCLGVVFYTYIGYGLLVACLIRIKKATHRSVKQHTGPVEPAVTLLVAAYNEESCLEDKIRNCFDLDYPEEKLELLFITDGSTDRSPEMITRHPRLRLMHQARREGKTAALNRAMKTVKTPIVIFSDANTLLNREAIHHMVKHYANPKVGGVAGEKRILKSENDTASGIGEGIYWRYESLLKKLDSDFYSVVGAAGELFSLRTQLYNPVEENVILDDFVISMRVALKGYRVKYEPEAYAMEFASVNLREEQKRKIRICAGGFQAMKLLKQAFNIFKFPLLSLQFFSHRVLRWSVTPVCLLLLWILNGVIIIIQPQKFFFIFFLLQALFYFSAWLGYLFSIKNYRIRALQASYYFIFMNMAVFMGFHKFYKGTQSVIWDKAKRVQENGFSK